MQTIKTFCNLPWNRMKVHFNGDVNMCCHQSFHKLGNLLENSWQEIWFSPIANEIRQETLQNKLHSYCSTTECPFNNGVARNPNQNFYVNDNGAPFELELDLHASHCNFGGTNATQEKTCIMCPRAFSSTKESFIKNPDKTLILIEKLKDLFPYLKSLCVMGLAEIFWRDKIFEIFDIINYKNYQEQIRFWAYTNGSVFTKERQQRFNDYTRSSLLLFSLDASTEETYLKIRKNKVFHKVLENLKSYNEHRKEQNNLGAKHSLVISNNINILNVHEVPDMVRMAADIGVDYINFSPTHDMGGHHTKINNILCKSNNWRLFAEAEKQAREIAEQRKITCSFVRPLDRGFQEKFYSLNLL